MLHWYLIFTDNSAQLNVLCLCVCKWYTWFYLGTKSSVFYLISQKHRTKWITVHFVVRFLSLCSWTPLTLGNLLNRSIINYGLAQNTDQFPLSCTTVASLKSIPVMQVGLVLGSCLAFTIISERTSLVSDQISVSLMSRSCLLAGIDPFVCPV